MKKFRYRLDPLLRLRQQEEEQKKRAVGSLLTEINRQQNQVLEMAADLAREGQQLRQQYAQGTVDLEWIRFYRMYVMHTQQAMARRTAEIFQIQTSLTAARQELTEAARKTKILEKLKEKKKNSYDYQLRREETRAQDEIGMNTFCRSVKD
ncbi:MAG: flagellar biosynthesis chaperone [Planctomycetes bacterium ADurb.Bin412]|nr:MAG: flagellar biosynthesis chaperone [Planctomycetes bacterium ADurb.Bin412]